MKVAVIKDNICENIIVVENLKTAKQIMGKDKTIVKAIDGVGIGDFYKNGNWEKEEPQEIPESEIDKVAKNLVEMRLTDLKEKKELKDLNNKLGKAFVGMALRVAGLEREGK